MVVYTLEFGKGHFNNPRIPQGASYAVVVFSSRELAHDYVDDVIRYHVGDDVVASGPHLIGGDNREYDFWNISYKLGEYKPLHCHEYILCKRQVVDERIGEYDWKRQQV